MTSILSFAADAVMLGTFGSAFAGSATKEAMDDDGATSSGVSKVPQGKQGTGTSCTSIEIGMGGETSYRCTVSWE